MINSNQESLIHLFNINEGPNIGKVKIASTSVSVDLHVPQNLSWFKGHFPQAKVLPGVVQLDWAGKLAKVLFVDLGEFKQLSNIKFKSMVPPETNMILELTCDQKKGTVKFHFFNQHESFSLGIFKFSTP